MLKLYICLFWQKNPDEHKQAHYDETTGHDLTVRSAAVLALTVIPLLAIGLFPNQVLLPLTNLSASFLNRSPMSHEVDFFSLTNLIGGGISLLIGVAVYLFYVRKRLYSEKEGYLNRWPQWLDLEELFYRPVFTRFLPWLGCTVASFLDSIPGSKLIMEWIPKGVSAVFAFLDHLPDSKPVKEWIPKGISAVFGFLDRLPESRLMTKVIPGVLTAVARIFDELVDHVMLLIKELFLTNREELKRTRNHSVFSRLACAVAEGLHALGLLPGRFIHHKSPDDLRYGTYLTNAISFGLLLGAAGIVAAILYVFVRMGVQ